MPINRPLNIVFIARIYSDDYTGGSVTYFSQLAENFAKLGCKVHAIVATPFKNSAGIHFCNGVIVHKIYLPFKNSFLNYIYRNWSYWNIVRGINKSEMVDLINIQESGFIIFIKWDKTLSKITCVYTFHAAVHYEILYDYRKLKRDFGFFERVKKYIKMKVQCYKFKFTETSDLKHSKRIILMSDYVHGHIRKFYGNNFEAKIRKFPIGLFDSYFDQPKLSRESADEIVFFTLRRLEPRMGIDKLLRAINIVLKDWGLLNIHFVIGGKGSLQNELFALSKSLGVEKFVSFVGYLTEEEKLQYYNRANAFILPTQELEGFGIVIIEAWAANLPVIATNVGAIPELLNPISPEFLTSGTGENEIAEKIDFFLKKRSSYHKLTRFRDYAYYNYRWEPIAEKLLSEYRIVIAEE